jgi:hypothetical protein
VDSPAGYLHWNFILISIPNLLVIGLMVVLFALAVVVPFRHNGADESRDEEPL